MALENTWLLIPAYNEEATIAEVIKNSFEYIDNIIVINDGSRDNTARLAEEAGAIVLNHIVNLGKGAAMRTGCEYAFSNNAKYIITMDADGQHEPKDIPRFADELKSFEVVLGYRKRNKDMPLVFRLGNTLLNAMIQLLFSIQVKDTQSGYRAFSKKAYRKIQWTSTDYQMESEMIARIGRSKIQYTEIPIRTVYRDNYKGTTMLDGIRVGICMLWWRIVQ